MTNRGQHNRSAETIRAQLKKANANGRAFEEAVSESCRIWRAANVARIRKSYAPPRDAGGFGGVGGAAPVDFTGELADGMKVAFECKNITRTAAYTHDKDRMHQLVYLRRVRAHGGIAFVLLYDSDLGAAFICADLSRLAKGEAVPVRTNSSVGLYTAHLPETEVLHSENGTPIRLPLLLLDAREACAIFKFGEL